MTQRDSTMQYDMWNMADGEDERRLLTVDTISKVPRHSTLRPSTDSKACDARERLSIRSVHGEDETCDTMVTRTAPQQADDMCIEAGQARPRQASHPHQVIRWHLHRSGSSTIESGQALPDDLCQLLRPQ